MSMRKETPLSGALVSGPLARVTIGRPLVPMALSLAVVALAALAPWLVSAYELNLLARFLAMALLAMGLVLVWGQGGC
ncbi:hypothetical protein [Nitrospirillum sp. BR 11828]|uniref:hypothetical protein n=1 Tax=Nitrospirillum sp. BR 11828 TaxID=3104325 RepID=UPI002ACA22EF|nr:hypothetical protein [Nitrospirillum sp. BR 11828]MDZ5649756.1 hypothetical protein [Nitrospirillum sp. BR 11828]